MENNEGEIVEIQDDGFGSLIKRALKLTENTRGEISDYIWKNKERVGSLKININDWICELTTGDIIAIPDSLMSYIQKLESEIFDYKKESGEYLGGNND